MPKIRIERYPVQTFKLGVLGFDHLQLVYQPDAMPVGEAQDSWLLIEGLREWTADGVRLSVEGWEGRTTLAEANGGIFGYDLTERIETPLSRGSRVVPVDGDAFSAWATMASFAGDIEAQGFPYIAFALPGSPTPTINSSSLISSLLYYVGVDIASVMPYGARLSPGTTTLIGSSGDDHLSTVNSFTTIVSGEGRDALEGGEEAGHIDKLYGGKDDGRFAWSKGFNILHGGQPGLAYEKDGVDLVSYAGAGTVRIDVNRDALPHYRPDFIVTTASGLDHLYSIEQIAWDPSRDHIVLGNGVGLVERPTAPQRGTEVEQGDRLLVGALEAHGDPRDFDRGGQALVAAGGETAGKRDAALAPHTADETIALGASAFANYAALLDDVFSPGSEIGGIVDIDGLPEISAGDAASGYHNADDAHGFAF
jgi:hypothetical protein